VTAPRSEPPEAQAPKPPAAARTLAAGLALRQRAGGIAVPAVTVVIAFLMGGIVVLATGHNPLIAYRDIFDGAGLNWIFHPTTSLVPTSAYNLSQTLLQTTTLILCGLAVAFAFRCGMFNIGGQGQYFVGLYVANWLGVDLAGWSPFPHIMLCIVAAILAGAAWAGIAGFLKATVGAHEVISTIMLNWIAIYVGEWLFGDGGPLQNSTNPSSPISNDNRQLRAAARVLGPAAAAGPPCGALRGARGARRLLGDPQPHDARLRGAGGRLQPGGRGVRRDQREEEPDPRDGDLGRLRRPRRRDRHDGLPVPLRPDRHPCQLGGVSSASPSRFSAGTRLSGWGSAPSSSARSSSGRRMASPRT